MSPQEWLGLALRWVHLIAGIAWIGSSFYFIWLDAHLEPADPARADAEVEGSLWMVHSGGFYRVERRKIGPGRMPAILHWFKWEAFFTGLTGVALLTLVYYTTHGIYLTDPAVSSIRPGTAALLGATLLVAGWFVYDALWQAVGERWPAVALGVSLALLVGVTYGLTHVFSGRGAFIHVGALLGMLMVVNVWVRILPAQSAMIRATERGETPDFTLSAKAKRRSVHNSYMTFPVLFVMISNHFPGTYGSASPALVLLLLAGLGMGARYLMIGKSARRWWLAVPMIAVGAWLGVLVAPSRLGAEGSVTPAAALAQGPAPSYAAVEAIVMARCYACHSDAPRVTTFGAAPGGVNFEKPGTLQRYAERIRIRVVETRTMPLGNMTGMTEDERALLARWIAQRRSHIVSAAEDAMRQGSWLGQNPTRTDGEAKVTGRACYLDDMVLPGMLFGKTIRSTVARGTLRDVRFLPGVPWDEFTVVTARDIPGENVVHLIENDQPFLADGVIRHAAEPVVLIAHADKALVEKAARLVELVVDPLPAALTLEESGAQAARGESQYGADNVFKHFHVSRGDAKAALARAPVVVRGTYETGAQEQLYIEPQGALAVASPADGVTVWGSLQCPYYVHKALMPLFALPPARVRIIQTVTGGGFGGKEEYPNLIAGHAALLAWKSGRPVKIVYDRLEDMWATTKRHPSRTTIAAGFEKDGRLVGLDIAVELDGGAYVTLSPVVLSRGTLHAGGAYRCDDIAIDSRAVFTNAPPYGAFRGFGAPQTIFAIEMHMERAAKELGLDPVALRRMNFLHAGDTLPTGQRLKDEPGLDGLVDDALAAADWHAKRADHARANARPGAARRGLGLATFFHGSGFTGSGEVKLASRAALELTAGGQVRVLAASTDIGQGTNTVFAQIVADRLGLALTDIEIAVPDTRDVPDSGPTVASRTVMVVGGLLEAAATDLAVALRDAGVLAAGATGREAVLEALRAHGSATGGARFERQYAPPPDVRWDDATYTGDAYATYAWSAQVAEVEVDPLTAQASVVGFVAAQEVGRVLHPTLAAGQIEGGVAQGIGWALTEAVVLKDGAMANHQLTNYIVPTAMDAPPIRVLFKEHAYAHGPGGAKGIGELPMDGPAPAIGAALADALGVVLPVIPYLPERLLDAVEAAS